MKNVDKWFNHDGYGISNFMSDCDIKINNMDKNDYKKLVSIYTALPKLLSIKSVSIRTSQLKQRVYVELIQIGSHVKVHVVKNLMHGAIHQIRQSTK